LSLNKIYKFNIFSIFLFQILCILFFGRDFAKLNFLTLPGYINDYFLFVGFSFILFRNSNKIKKFLSQKKYFLFYFLSFFIFYISTSESNQLNHIGQDLIVIIYPVIIYLIIYLADFKIALLDYSWNKLMNIMSILYILDFILEKIPIFERLLWIDFQLINILPRDFINLRITEMSALLLMVFFIYSKSNQIHFKDIIFPLCFLTLASSQSRTVLISVVAYLICEILFTNYKHASHYVLGFALGFLMASSFVMNLDTPNIKLIFNSDSKIDTIRSNDLDCYLDNFFGDKRGSNCEIYIYTLENFDSEVEYVESISIPYYNIESENKKLRSNLNINTPIFQNYLNAYDNLNDKGGYDSILTQLDKCIHHENCDDEKIKALLFFTESRNNLYSEYICTDNILWRTHLWKKAVKDQSSSVDTIFFGKGVGFSIPVATILKSDLRYFCYLDSISNEPILRNAHNTFLTIYYRFGVINSLILFSVLMNLLILPHIKNLYSFLLSISILTIFEPVLDAPIVAIPFWFILFSYIKYISYENRNLNN
jgi:hypothetical protein